MPACPWLDLWLGIRRQAGTSGRHDAVDFRFHPTGIELEPRERSRITYPEMLVDIANTIQRDNDVAFALATL